MLFFDLLSIWPNLLFIYLSTKSVWFLMCPIYFVLRFHSQPSRFNKNNIPFSSKYIYNIYIQTHHIRIVIESQIFQWHISCHCYVNFYYLVIGIWDSIRWKYFYCVSQMTYISPLYKFIYEKFRNNLFRENKSNRCI